MGIDFSDWCNRISSRSDLTGRLTHLTRPSPSIDLSGMSFPEINLYAVDNLLKILSDKKLNGGTGCTIGEASVVCFQDVPLYPLIQNVIYENSRREKLRKRGVEEKYIKLRYCGVGISFPKIKIYNNGGRPAIYGNTSSANDIYIESSSTQTESQTKLFRESLSWRLVDLNLTNPESITDWTHEREWRIQGDMSFEFDSESGVHVILYDPACYKKFITECPYDIIKKISGITTLMTVIM